MGLTDCSPDLFETHQNIIISSLNIPLSITAFLGNALIIFALQKPSSLHPPSKLLLGCLASTDLCVGLITQPLFVTYLMSPSKHCYFQVILTVIGATLSAISLLRSFLTLTTISVDRLLALTLGLRYRHVVTLGRVRVLVVCVSLFSTVNGVIPYYNFFRIYGIFACIEAMFCIATSSFCYTKIYLKLRHHQAEVQDHVHQGQPNGGGGISLNIARYKKTVSSALWVQITLVVCYLPYAIASAIRTTAITGSHTQSLDLTWAATSSFVLLNSSLNPFLYCWKMREVRQAVKDTVKQFWCFSS
ncbi:melanocortin receptor 5-like [Oculina patagonica]